MSSVEHLPEGCVATVLSFTCPEDACRLSAVSSFFKSAAESDTVWEKFLPPGYDSIVFRSAEGLRLLDPSTSKKQIFLSLSDSPLLIDGGKMSFWLDKWSGKKCYMISARDLVIVWGDTPRYWKWTSETDSRFREVAELVSVCWFEIHGKIDTSMLSTETLYGAYLVFKPTAESYGFEYQTVEVGVGLVGSESYKRSVYLDFQRGERQPVQFVVRRFGLLNRVRTMGVDDLPKVERDGNSPKERKDGWLEIELGEYFNEGGDDGELEMFVLEVQGGNWKGGLIVQGIEIRPKGCKSI